MFVMLLTVAMSYGQIAYQKTTPFDNTYVGIEGGAYAPLSFDHTFPINGTAGIKIGKNFNTVFGLNIEGQTWFGSNTKRHTAYFNRFDCEDVHNVVRGLTVGMNGTVNLTNAFLGYNPNKVFEVSTETGLGWLHTFNANMFDANDLYTKSGLIFAWNVNAIQLYVNPTVYWNLTRDNWSANHGIKFNKNYAEVGLNIGVNYRFKTSNGTRNFKTYDIGVLNDEINTLRNKNKELSLAASRIPTEVVRTDTITDVVNGQYFVFFAQNSYELSDEAKNTLNYISAGTVVDVKASASPEGTKRYNKNLSLNRANAVANYLKDRGVIVNSVEGLGAYDNTSNRVACVIIAQ